MTSSPFGHVSSASSKTPSTTLARLVEHELNQKLEAEVKRTFDTYALDMVSRAQRRRGPGGRRPWG